MPWHPTLTDLRSIFATLYPTVEDARRVVVDAGLDPLRIAFDAKAITNWQYILEEARRNNRVDELLQVARNEYAEHPGLVRAVQAYRAAFAATPAPSTESQFPMSEPSPVTTTRIQTAGGMVNTGNVTVAQGDLIGRDKHIHGDDVRGNKIVNIYYTAAGETTPTPPAPDLATAGIPRQPYEPETVLIPAGPFWMGSDDGPEQERPRHEVTLWAYRIGKFPVTNLEYAVFVQAENNTEHRPRGGGWRFTTPPADQLHQAVTHLRWSDAVAYCTWLTAESGRCYRLPSEAEWEKALQTSIITNEIREWTTTIWGDDANRATFVYPYQEDGRDSMTVQGVYRIWRGGAMNPAQRSRGFASPTSRLNDLGLRVVLAFASA